MYTEDYMVYDEIGIVSVNCMRCNVPIRVRRFKNMEIEGEAVKVAYIKTLPEFTPVPFTLSNGSNTNILLCLDCSKNMNTEDELEGMTRQFRHGHQLEAKYAKRSEKDTKAIEKFNNKLSVKGNKPSRMKLKGVG
jgi:hypothetical protein